mgnify:CR=1 FL=1
MLVLDCSCSTARPHSPHTMPPTQIGFRPHPLPVLTQNPKTPVSSPRRLTSCAETSHIRKTTLAGLHSTSRKAVSGQKHAACWKTDGLSHRQTPAPGLPGNPQPCNALPNQQPAQPTVTDTTFPTETVTSPRLPHTDQPPPTNRTTQQLTTTKSDSSSTRKKALRGVRGSYVTSR